MSDISPTHPSLSTLPNELIEEIAKVADPPDPLALRLTCRTIEQGTIRVVIEAHFTQRSFLLHYEASLKKLTRIIQHELFSRSLRSIWFATDAIPDCNQLQLVHFLKDRAGKGRRWHALVQEQKKFKKSYRGTTYLGIVFLRLRELSVDIEIGIGSQNDAFERPRESKELEALCGVPLRDASGEDHQAVYVILEAVRLSMMKLPKLRISDHGWIHGVRCINCYSKWRLADVFRGLTSLHLELQFLDSSKLQNENIAEAAKVVQAASSLEDLVLTIRGNPKGGEDVRMMYDVVERILGVTYHNLKVFSLARGVFDFVKFFSGFVARHRKLHGVSLTKTFLMIPMAESELFDSSEVEGVESGCSVDDVVRFIKEITGLGGVCEDEIRVQRSVHGPGWTINIVAEDISVSECDLWFFGDENL
jgi:hypothetical protein